MILLSRLASAEIPPISERWRPLVTLYMAGFSIFYAVGFLFSLHFIFLGPGLGDEFTLKYLLGLMQHYLDLGSETGTLIYFWAFLSLLVTSTAFRAWIVYRSYAEFRTEDGGGLPLNELLTFTLLNLLNLFFAPALLLVCAAVAWGLGYSPEAGWHLLATLAAQADALVREVPTVVTLPRWLAFFCTIMIWSFLHYWLHRWSHTRRSLWLLLHRPHHMTPHLCYATTLPVFMSFPFFLFIALPYLFLFGAAGKLFSPEPLYAEMILFQLVIYMGEIYGHSPALYEKAIRNPLVRFISHFYSQGVYHIIHHSAAMDTRRKTSNNTVNIGVGLFFCWDRLFGTYEPLPEKLPPIGLHGQPALVMNPIRLLCAGVMQIVHELWNNRSPLLWWKILAGPANYTPPVSRDFAVHSSRLKTEEEKHVVAGAESC